MSGSGKVGDVGRRSAEALSNGGGDRAKVAGVEGGGGAGGAVAEFAEGGARHEDEDCICSGRGATAVRSS